MALTEYIPTPWVNGTAPAINSTNLSHIENGVKSVTDEVLLIEDGTVPVGHALVADSLSGGVSAPGEVPIGTMAIWAAEAPPLNWEVCRGQDMSTSTYAELFSVLGSTFGSTSPGVFSLPDTRGRFVRGFDSANLNDPEVGRVFGSAQDDEFESHEHVANNVGVRSGNGPTDDDSSAGPDSMANVLTTSAGGAETRPKNIALTYIIRVL